MGSLDLQTDQQKLDMILILLLASRAAYTAAIDPNIWQIRCQILNLPGCQSDGIQCRYNKDCEWNEICSRGRCTEVSDPGYCRNKHDCEWNEICSRGKCIPTSDQGYCRNKHECEQNEICSRGKCIPTETEEKEGEDYFGQFRCGKGQIWSRWRKRCVRTWW